METTGTAPVEFLKANEVADRFRVTAQSVYRWARKGQIDSVRIGGVVRFSTADVERLLAGEPRDA